MKRIALACGFLRLFLIGLLTLGGLSACGGGGPDEPTLTAVEISPLAASRPLGTSQQYSATALFSNSTKVNVTGQATWQSSDPLTVSISASGLARTLKTGTVTISASYQGQSASTPLTVTAATATAVSVTPSNASLPKGSNRAYTAMATFTDNSTQDVTASAEWSSDTTSVATVGNTAGNKGRVTAVAQGNSAIRASFQGASGATPVTVTAAVLASIEVTPSNSSFAKGTSKQFTATAVYTDSTTQNVTSTATWSSSDAAIASISNASLTKGRASAVAEGVVTISASSGGLSGSTQLTVTAAELTALQVTPANSSRPKGATQQFTATGTYTDMSTQDLTDSVVWSSNTTTVATISNAAGSSGLASALAEGSTTIRAASGAISSSTPFTVTAAVLARIEVTPAEPSIPVGTTQQFTATGVYTDNSTQDFTAVATWASSSSAVLEVSNSDGSRGFSAANAKGTATVSATHMGLSGSTLATVSDAALSSIAVTPANGKLAKGMSLQFTATGTYSDGSTREVTTQVTWASTNPGSVTVSNADGSRGLATATTVAGTSNISATAGSVRGATSLTVSDVTLQSIAVTPTNPSLPKGGKQQLTATGSFSDGSTQDLTRQASWSSSDPTLVTVSNGPDSPGLADAVAEGTVTVTAAVTQGGATAATTGTTQVTVTAAALQSIAVTPAAASVAKGQSQPYQADGRYSDNTVKDITTEVTWSSSNTTVATISNAAPDKGSATARAVGSATITASLGSISSTASFTGTDAVLTGITISPPAPSVAAGRSQQFTASGTYSDGSSQDLTGSVTWSSSATDVATISNAAGSRGLATSSKVGTTDITAQSGAIVSATAAKLTVTAAVPVSISVTPANKTISNKTSQQYQAIETFSDGSTLDQTANVTWSSSNPAIATISNAVDSKGLANAVAVGSVTITATDASVTPNVVGSTPLTVGPATLQSIKVTAELASLPSGYKVHYYAEGTYSDASKQDITTTVNWSVLNTAVATVSNTAGSKGVVTTVTTGGTTVRAALGDITGTASITVSTATLSSIAVTPANPTIVGDDTLQFTATATFSDGGKLNITTQVTWASSSTQVVSIDQAGLATGGSFPGNATISAAKSGITGQTTATHRLF